MLVISIQNKEVLNTLLSGKTHIAKSTTIKNLSEPYEKMRTYYNWDNTPVFGCVIGKYAEFYGANSENAVVLKLNIPDNIIKLQPYYDWSDVIYFMEVPSEWETGDFDTFVRETLDGKRLETEDDLAVQATFPYIDPKWLVDYKDACDTNIDHYNGSGGNYILEDMFL